MQECEHELYRRLSTPFEAESQASKNLDEFMQKVYELREEYHIQECMVIGMVCAKVDEGVKDIPAVAQFGDAHKCDYLVDTAEAFAIERRATRRRHLGLDT